MTAVPPLAIDVAWLRLGCEAGGIKVGVPGARHWTPELRAIVGRGDLAIMRPGRDTRRPSVVLTTSQGIDRIDSICERHGDEFGPISLLGHGKVR